MRIDTLEGKNQGKKKKKNTRRQSQFLYTKSQTLPHEYIKMETSHAASPQSLDPELRRTPHVVYKSQRM